MKKRSPKNQHESILQALRNKKQADPEMFRAYLPEIAQELEQLFPSQRRSSLPPALTEQERERLRQSLFQLLSKKELPAAEAIQALEYCATFIQDRSLPDEITRQTLLSLFHQAIDIPLSKIEKATSIPVGQGEEVKMVAPLCGVHLHLTWNDRLVAISVSPAKLKKRSKALKLVGIAKDTAPDVAQRHDAYLAEAIRNAA